MTTHLPFPATPASFDADARGLLQSIVNVARAIFGAAASSIFLLDGQTGELVFQAVAGEGEGFLVGTRIPARGIAGWVLGSGEAMVVEDLRSNESFARDLAAGTGYLPQALMAVPLIDAEDVLGVLEVLDPAPQSRSNLDELELLTLFACQAAIALRVVTTRRASTEPVDDDQDLVHAFQEFLQARR
ncbi:MAG: histidine kinase [Amycolatopsis sp.]|jgi:GAF domain-containing protein|uniref:GAF domain-containing protein n=1 Tax=Amycolatopsis sp. TaxID=37632 RepID=UPI0026310E59|nr:GAF domain-containing protein [Amycolatopsis sp.]MCU1684441.1 histidine kinase [Amycolatopsis sp.]